MGVARCLHDAAGIFTHNLAISTVEMIGVGYELDGYSNSCGSGQQLYSKHHSMIWFVSRGVVLPGME
jgi:hypothetical protein